MLQTTGFHICKQKTIDNCTWNLSLKFIEVRIFCYLMPVIGKNMISWFYAYVEHIEIKTKTVNIIHFPYLDLSQNVKIRDVPYSLKSPGCLSHIQRKSTRVLETTHSGNTFSLVHNLSIRENKSLWCTFYYIERHCLLQSPIQSCRSL